MATYKRILFLLSLYLCLHQIKGEDNCTFSDLVLRCITHPDALTRLTVYALVNYCNEPVDVTFELQDMNSSWTWEYTFVNVGETQPLTGLAEDAQLHVALETINGNELFVQANLVLQGSLVTPFLDEEVILPECQESDSANVYLPLIIFVVLLILIILLIGMMISYRRERHRKTAQLLSNMEGPLGTPPYQEEPINTEYTDDPNNPTTTVIQNNIYRDSMLLEQDSTANGLIVAYTDPGNADGRQPIYNPRNKKNYRRNKPDVRSNSGREEEVILRVQNINPQQVFSGDHDKY